MVAAAPPGLPLGQALEARDGLQGHAAQAHRLQEGLDAKALLTTALRWHQGLVGQHRGRGLQPQQVGTPEKSAWGPVATAVALRPLPGRPHRPRAAGWQAGRGLVVQLGLSLKCLLGDVGLLEALLENVAGLVAAPPRRPPPPPAAGESRMSSSRKSRSTLGAGWLGSGFKWLPEASLHAELETGKVREKRAQVSKGPPDTAEAKGT